MNFVLIFYSRFSLARTRSHSTLSVAHQVKSEGEKWREISPSGEKLSPTVENCLHMSWETSAGGKRHLWISCNDLWQHLVSQSVREITKTVHISLIPCGFLLIPSVNMYQSLLWLWWIIVCLCPWSCDKSLHSVESKSLDMLNCWSQDPWGDILSCDILHCFIYSIWWFLSFSIIIWIV